jgi:hypothetical protein
MNRTSDFFQEIEHPEVPWRTYQLHVPVFYPDMMLMTVSFLAPTERIKAILPSKRLHPYRITPWHSLVSISAYMYRDCDLGPYNEIGIDVPVTLDRPTPLFAGSLRKLPDEPMSYVHTLPVTTEIARVVGAEFAGYPKFVAQIDFADEDGWIRCDLHDNDQHVLTLCGRKLDLSRAPRVRTYPLTQRRGYILRSEFIGSEREMGASRSSEDAKLELGDHPIAQELRELALSRVMAYYYCPAMQGVLTPVIESYAV